MTDAWDPERYARFAAERRQPFDDLVRMLRPHPAADVVDLGCGSGELTAELHVALRARSTLGIDSSEAMLARAPVGMEGVRFARGDIRDLGALVPPASADVVLSNAALQWVGDHEDVLGEWVARLRPGGQLAVQLPDNDAHASHVVAREVFGEPDLRWPVLSPEGYALALDRLGLVEQQVRLQVYVHRLPSSASVVDWVRGTYLTRWQARLSPQDFEAGVEEYRRRLLAVLGDVAPYVYTYRRLLLWARAEG